MAGKIRGITIQLDGDTSGLTKSLKDANKEIKDTQSQLKDVEKLLKLDPNNVELLRQKEVLLNKAIGETKDKLDTLKKAEETMKSQGVDENSEQFMALQREIIATEDNLKSLEKSAKNTKSAFDKIGDATKKISEGAKKVATATRGLSAAGAAVAGGLLATGTSAIQTADDLATLSARTGLSTDMLQKFAFASDMVDVSTEELAGAVAKMKKTMGENPEAFENLGIEVRNADGTFRDLESVLYDSLNALSQIEDETQRDLTAMDLFGKSADTLATIIDDGGASLQEYGQKAQDMGLILSEETIGKLTDTGDQIDTLKATAMSTMTEVGAELLEKLAPTLETIIEKVGEIISWIGSLDSDTLNMILTVGLVIAAISPVASLIAGISTAVGALSAAISFLMANPVVLLIAGIAALVVLIIKNWDKIKETLSAAWTKVTEIFGNIKNKLNEFGNWLTNIFSQDWSESFGGFGDILNGLFKTVKDVWADIKGVFNGIIKFFKDVFKGDWSAVWGDVKDIFKNVFDGLVAIAKAPLNLIIGLINGMIDGINWMINGINSINVTVPDWVPGIGGRSFGFSLRQLGKLAYLAQGGILEAGSAVVGEAGPELLTMSNRGAVVQPLTNNTANHNYGGITLNVYGAAGQNVQELAEIIMDEIGNATRRQEAAFA